MASLGTAPKRRPAWGHRAQQHRPENARGVSPRGVEEQRTAARAAPVLAGAGGLERGGDGPHVLEPRVAGGVRVAVGSPAGGARHLRRAGGGPARMRLGLRGAAGGAHERMGVRRRRADDPPRVLASQTCIRVRIQPLLDTASVERVEQGPALRASHGKRSLEGEVVVHAGAAALGVVNGIAVDVVEQGVVAVVEAGLIDRITLCLTGDASSQSLLLKVGIVHAENHAVGDLDVAVVVLESDDAPPHAAPISVERRVAP